MLDRYTNGPVFRRFDIIQEDRADCKKEINLLAPSFRGELHHLITTII